MAASRPTSPRPGLLPGGQASSRRQDRRHRHGPQAGPALLPHSEGNGPRSGVRHALLDLNIPAGTDGRARPSSTSGSPRSAPVRRMHASHHAGRPYNTDATAAPTGGHPISIVVTDGISLVADLGNAGRPYRRHQPAQTGPQRQGLCSQAKKGLDNRAPYRKRVYAEPKVPRRLRRRHLKTRWR